MSDLLFVSDHHERRALVQSAVDELGDVDELNLLFRDGLPASGAPQRDAKDLADGDPLIVIFDGTDESEHVFDVAGELDRLRSDIGLIVVAERSDETLTRALRAGVREIVPPDVTRSAMSEAIVRVHEIADRRRGERREASDQQSRAGRVICVLSPKGGVGKTMLATNLGVGLASAAPRQVALIDLDLQFGDVSNALRLVPEQTIADAVDSGLEDATAVKLSLTSHSTGLFAMCAPEDPGEADEIRAEHVAKLLPLLAGEFEYVIIDTDPGLGEQTLAAIEIATDLVFVCATDVASVRGLRKELVALDRIGMTHQRRHFVLNRADARVGLSADDIGATIAMPVDVFVPSSRSVPLAMNQGTALLEDDIQSPATNPLWHLVKRFADIEIAPEDNQARGFRRRRS